MFKKILNTFGTKILAAVLNFAIAIIISQTLGDTGSGTQSLVLTSITFILIFSEIVCGASIIYLAPRHSFKKILVASVIWSALIAVIMGFCIKLFYPKLESDLVVHVAILSFISSLSNINFRFLVGKEEIQKANYNTLLQPVLLTITLVVYYIALKKTDIYGYIIGLYVAYGGTFLLGVWMLREEYANLPNDKDKEYKPVLKDLFKYGFLNQTGHFVQFFNLRLSYYLLDNYIGRGQVGVFSRSVSLAEAIWIISNSIALVQYARIANTDDREYSQKLTLDLSKICLLISAVAACLSLGRHSIVPATACSLHLRLRSRIRRDGGTHPHPGTRHLALLHFPHPRTLLLGHRTLSDEHLRGTLRIGRHLRLWLHADTSLWRHRRSHHVGSVLCGQCGVPVCVLRQGVALQRS